MAIRLNSFVLLMRVAGSGARIGNAKQGYCFF